MKIPGKILFLAALAGIASLRCAGADSVAVTDHEVVGFASKANPTPKQIMVTIEVAYTLTSKSNAVLRLALDQEAEMKFAVVQEQPVTANPKKQKVTLRFTLGGFKRDLLRGIVLLADPAADANAKPLTMSGFSLDVKKFKNG